MSIHDTIDALILDVISVMSSAGITITKVSRSSASLNPTDITPPSAFIIWNREINPGDINRQRGHTFDVAMFCKDEKSLLDLAESFANTYSNKSFSGTGFFATRSNCERFDVESPVKETDHGLAYSYTVLKR